MQVILLLYGGRSSEHEVSCISASFIDESLRAAGYKVLPVYIKSDGEPHLQERAFARVEDQVDQPCSFDGRGKLMVGGRDSAFDMVFPIIHGTFGEDGSVQGFCEFIGAPYAGSGVLTSALCMDKKFMRKIFADAGLPQVTYFALGAEEWQADQAAVINQVEASMAYPLFVKPCNMGSSVGVHRVAESAQLGAAIDDAFKYDRSILVEQGYQVRELEVAILGNYPNYELSVIGEIIPRHDYYSYEAKYLDEEGAELVFPARLEKDQEEELLELAQKAFAAVRGDGFARIDFFMVAGGELFLNEINTLPGFTSISMFPKLWAEAGVNAKELVKRIVELGFSRHQAEKKIKRSR